MTVQGEFSQLPNTQNKYNEKKKMLQVLWLSLRMICFIT